MSDSLTNHALAPRSVALAKPADELELQAMEGAARWLGHTLQRIAFRLMSMVEQPLASMSGPLSPVDGYFRRDRHRHPKVDPETYALRVTGVTKPRSFTLAELQALPQEERVLVMECAGNGNHLMGSAGLLGQARWKGPSLRTVLQACGGAGPATHFAFHGLDPVPLWRRGYHYGLSLPELEQAQALLALEMNGAPLPRPRGFPLRVVVPGIYSMSHVKWLGHIEGKTSPHMGIHNRWVFTNKERRDGKWERVQARWIGLKSVITRCRRAEDGWHLTGWAWGGGEPIDRVEVSTDGGKSWQLAQLHAPGHYFGNEMTEASFEHAWSVFDFRWPDPAPGRYRLGCRAYARSGKAQALEPNPNVHGHFDQTRVKWRRVDVP